MKKYIQLLLATVMLLVPAGCNSSENVDQETTSETYAVTENTAIDNEKDCRLGKVYVSEDKKDIYSFSNTENFLEADSTNVFGDFSIKGDYAEKDAVHGVPTYEIGSEELTFYYSYDESMLNGNENEWHLIEDKSKKIDSISLKEDILKGAIVVQTSKDRLNWFTVSCMTNVFADNSLSDIPLYTANDLQYINGCYYRVIVAYETERCLDPTAVFKKYDNKKHAEIYEFYALSPNGQSEALDHKTAYKIGNTCKAEQFTGYYGEKEITKDDPHYGYEVGSFYVSGYTDKRDENNNNVIFLKNAKDKVVLWYKLEQNIDALGGNSKISITADEENNDQYFQTPTIDFGRGTLIVHYTDSNNQSPELKIYTNYLEANASVDADTRVQLFEEGDYEVALDYEITNDKLVDTINHYRTSFKFSVRNGDCMFFPFDLKTGQELTNCSMTENGFRIDLAKSRYLDVVVKRDVLSDSAFGLVEDTRFNSVAADGSEFTQEGVYTVSVHNRYTDQTTVKKIYVGSDKVIHASIVNDKSISEIKELVENGAEINDKGEIILPVISETEEIVTQTTSISEEAVTEVYEEVENDENSSFNMAAVISVLAIAVVGVICAVIVKQRGIKILPKNNDMYGDDQ